MCKIFLSNGTKIGLNDIFTFVDEDNQSEKFIIVQTIKCSDQSAESDEQKLKLFPNGTIKLKISSEEEDTLTVPYKREGNDLIIDIQNVILYCKITN